MKHYFDENGKELPARPDPWKGRSPVSDALFAELGGTITDDGELAPTERVLASFTELIADLARKTDKIMPVLHMAAA